MTNQFSYELRHHCVWGHKFPAIACFVQLQLGESIQKSLQHSTDWSLGSTHGQIHYQCGRRNHCENLWTSVLTKIQNISQQIEVNQRFKSFQILTLGLKLNAGFAPFICVLCGSTAPWEDVSAGRGNYLTGLNQGGELSCWGLIDIRSNLGKPGYWYFIICESQYPWSLKSCYDPAYCISEFCVLPELLFLFGVYCEGHGQQDLGQ